MFHTPTLAPPTVIVTVFGKVTFVNGDFCFDQRLVACEPLRLTWITQGVFGTVGVKYGVDVGSCVGVLVGVDVGSCVGISVGVDVGAIVGINTVFVGATVAVIVGTEVGV